VTFAESFLSAKASASGKGPSPRGSLLSTKAPNPVVYCTIAIPLCGAMNQHMNYTGAQIGKGAMGAFTHACVVPFSVSLILDSYM
jgi:hypothetical protein